MVGSIRKNIERTYFLDITNECEEQEPRGNFWFCFFLVQ